MPAKNKPLYKSLTTAPVTVTFKPYLDMPDTSPFGQDKYHIQVAIKKDDDGAKVIIDALNAMAKEKWPDLDEFHSPLKDGDKKNADRKKKKKDPVELYEGSYYFDAKSKNPPASVINASLDTISPTDVRPGNVIRLNLTLATYESPAVGEGISIYLNKVQKLSEGTPMGGMSDEAAFGDDVSAQYAEDQEDF